MIDAAAVDDSLFFQMPESRRGFTRIRDLAIRSLQCIREGPGGRGDAGQMLQKIQCGTFGRQQ